MPCILLVHHPSTFRKRLYFEQIFINLLILKSYKHNVNFNAMLPDCSIPCFCTIFCAFPYQFCKLSECIPIFLIYTLMLCVPCTSSSSSSCLAKSCICSYLSAVFDPWCSVLILMVLFLHATMVIFHATMVFLHATLVFLHATMVLSLIQHLSKTTSTIDLSSCS